jgi:hypothetical protein
MLRDGKGVVGAGKEKVREGKKKQSMLKHEKGGGWCRKRKNKGKKKRGVLVYLLRRKRN